MENVKRHQQVKYAAWAVVALIIVVIVILAVIPNLPNEKVPAAKIVCMTNLKHFAIALQLYQTQNDTLFAHDKWCDVIKPYTGPDDTRGCQCPADKIGPCSYAMNENIPADAEKLPDDLVIFFESVPGWNQVGQANDVVTNRHDEPGANIAFADGRVEFVRPEDISHLKWTMEE